MRRRTSSSLSSGPIATAPCTMIGPWSVSSSTKWTVAPATLTPYARAWRWASRPLKEGSSAGWMFMMRSGKALRSTGVTRRSKPASSTSSTPASRSAATTARSKSSRRAKPGCSMTRVGMPAASARARPGAPARFETTTRSAQSSWRAAMRSMIACRLVPVPEMSAPAATTRSLRSLSEQPRRLQRTIRGSAAAAALPEGCSLLPPAATNSRRAPPAPPLVGRRCASRSRSPARSLRSPWLLRQAPRAPEGALPAIGLEHPVLPRGAALEDGALFGVGEDVEVLALDAAHDAAGDLLGADDAARHGGALGGDRPARIAQRRGPVADRVLVDVGLDDHRAEDADADALLGELAVQGLGEPDHGELGGAVDAEPAHPDQPRHGGRVDDVSAGAAREQAGHEGLDAVHDAPEVDVHGVLPVGVRRGAELAHGGDAGVVAHDVHGAEAPLGCVGERAHALERGHVGRHGEHLGAALAERGGHPLHCRPIDVGEHDVRAARSEGARHRCADPAAAAGDDGDPSLEGVHGRQAYSAPRPVTSAGQGAPGGATRTA